MPAIWNINNIYGVNNKKVSSKLTFEVGEKFSGRIVKTLEGKNEVLVKLSDGWQFAAEIDGDSEVIAQEGLIRFQVEGFENGKLKLKVIEEKNPQGFNQDDIIESFLKSEGLSSEDKALVEKMIKHNMRITREEVLQLKSILSFHEKLQGDIKEGNTFIEKYLVSKGIAINSEKGQDIKKLLEGFIKSFKELSDEEVLIMLENGLDFSEESIESFKKLSKDFSGVEKSLKDIGNLIDHEEYKAGDTKGQINSKTIEGTKEVLEEGNKEIKEEPISSSISGKEVETEKQKAGQMPDNVENKTIEDFNNDNGSLQKALRAKALGEIYSSGNKVNMLQLLKAMAASDKDILKYALEDLLDNRKSEFIFSGDLDKFQEKLKYIDDKSIIETLKEECKASNTSLDKLTKNIAEEGIFRLLGRRISLSNKEFEKLQNVINFVMDQEKPEEPDNTLIKAKDIPDEKDIIEASKLSVDIKEAVDETNKTLNMKNSEEKSIENKEPILPQTKEEAVKQQLIKHGEDLKLLIKDILKLVTDGKNITKGGSEEPSNTELINNLKTNEKLLSEKVGEKIFEIIKNNINDFKVFNSLSNQYYSLSLPVTLKEREYPCKIIIKDDRKNGKKVDSTNTKLVVSIKTVKLGEVDGFLSFKNKTLNVDLKCEEKFVKALDAAKANLEESLRKLGFTAHVVVSKKIEDVTLTSCREFFNDNHISAVNVIV